MFGSGSNTNIRAEISVRPRSGPDLPESGPGQTRVIIKVSGKFRKPEVVQEPENVRELESFEKTQLFTHPQLFKEVFFCIKS